MSIKKILSCVVVGILLLHTVFPIQQVLAAIADHILITEVQYDPSQSGTDTDYEWFELFNPTSGTVSLS